MSRAAALGFSEAERQIYHATLEIAATPLMPMIPFAPAAVGDRALARAA